MRHAEDALQAAVMRFIRHALPDALAWHTPNGGRRNPREAARLKGMGVTPGIPDVLILADGRLYGIELKTKTGRIRPEQRAVIERMDSLGCPVAVCHSLDDVQSALEDFGFSLRATTGRADLDTLEDGEAAA